MGPFSEAKQMGICLFDLFCNRGKGVLLAWDLDSSHLPYPGSLLSLCYLTLLLLFPVLLQWRSSSPEKLKIIVLLWSQEMRPSGRTV